VNQLLSPTMQDDWKSVDVLPQLKADEVQVWRLELSDDAGLLPACTKYLTIEEQARAERKRAGQVREQFTVARACLRILLGNAFGVGPHHVPIVENPYGKPEASVIGHRLSFNVTHSKGTILIALCKEGTVGVDAEHIDSSTDVMEIAQSTFSSKEFKIISSQTLPEARRLAFYRCWTQKEAVIKADGRGLSLSLSCFDVPVSPANFASVYVIERPGDVSKHYVLNDIALGRDVVGAIATDSPNCRMNWMHFPLSILRNHPVEI
jgi:4'-phosphopantetheinyl transferase